MAKKRISRENEMVRRGACLVMLLMILHQVAAFAQETSRAGRWIDSISLNVFVSSGYSYNPNDPDSGKNYYHVFDIDENTFKIDVLELSLQKDAALPGSSGFRMDLTTGSSVPKVTRSAGLSIGDLDFHQMYLSYVVPAGNGLKLDLGKFVTAMGYEVIEGYDGFNDNYTRSFLFGYAIPFTHTGIRGSYKFSERLSAMFMLVNGWDNAIDNNMSKSICEQISFAPADKMGIALTHMIGPEKAQDDVDYRNSFDIVASDTVSSGLSVGFNGDYSTEMHSADGNGMGLWWGVAGYLQLQFSVNTSLAVRCEQFADVDGIRTGLIQKLQEVTLTPSFRLTPQVILRGDVRIDQSDEKVFEKGIGRTHTQPTISVNVLYIL